MNSGKIIRSKCFYPPPLFNLETAVGSSNNSRLAVGDFSGDKAYRGNCSRPFHCKCFFLSEGQISAWFSLQPPYFPQFYSSSEGQFVSWAPVLFVGARRRMVEDVKWNPLITSQAIRDNCEGRARKTRREEERASGKREVSKGKQDKLGFVVWGFLRTTAFAFNFPCTSSPAEGWWVERKSGALK